MVTKQSDAQHGAFADKLILYADKLIDSMTSIVMKPIAGAIRTAHNKSK
jgi:hypothetical protein